MIRGTTAPFKFKLPYTWDKVCAARATFKQIQDNGETLTIVKTYDTRRIEHPNPGGFTPDPNDNSIVYVVLNSNETLQFSDKRKANVQFKSYCEDNGVIASKLQKFTVYPIEDSETFEELPNTPSVYDGIFVLDAGEILAGGES